MMQFSSTFFARGCVLSLIHLCGSTSFVGAVTCEKNLLHFHTVGLYIYIFLQHCIVVKYFFFGATHCLH